ncbi:putative ribonuclease H-like domain-containing protein [Tanacetum coccineum]|uniref:Ribonuclease H-like domain-containing protein n=1 Tax=Tanacetum coccineum TaxID=301880 RepID=A0ABQ5J2B7_9ASTR
MFPKAILIKNNLKPLNTVRPVNTTHPKTTVHSARPMSHFTKIAPSTLRRPIQKKTTLTNRSIHQRVNIAKGKVNTVKPKTVKTARPKAVNTARPSPAVVNAIRENQGHPQNEDQGYVDCGCSRHMTSNMSYLSDYKEFDRGYVTFGEEQKEEELLLGDESQVLLKVPRKDNMYSVDIRNIVPKKKLTCLVAKATLDESLLWHKRLGYINFKNINKLVKDNLARGLSTKRFKNDQTCVACLKGKQHKSSCKSKFQNSISQPLFMLHMNLFGPTFVSSLMHKKYGLVVIDDYRRFTWVLFLASKDETSGILKKFITEIENLVDKKVKIIRCDNETEFKNSVMNDFCAMKADSKLPTTFWAEAVNTACYVQNRVLVVKPHNKTPYELFRGRTPALSFMRPFGCYVTILNTLDHLGKFDGKSDDGFFVGYSLNTKAFRVYNIRTKKVEENLHVRFLEDKPIIAGTEESVGLGHSNKETGSSQDCILMPLWKDGSLFGPTSENDES